MHLRQKRTWTTEFRRFAVEAKRLDWWRRCCSNRGHQSRWTTSRHIFGIAILSLNRVIDGYGGVW